MILPAMAGPEQKWQVEFLHVPSGARTVLEVHAGDFIEAHRRALQDLRRSTGRAAAADDLAAALEFSAEHLLVRIQRII
jgi:hypothetical protein